VCDKGNGGILYKCGGANEDEEEEEEDEEDEDEEMIIICTWKEYHR
jgi:hypothetical protein